MRKKKDVTLSSFLKEQQIINRKEIDLSKRGITTIDDVSPFLCSEIESLNLAGNRIVSVRNLAQFTALKELDVSSNKIVDCNELSCLTSMVNLRKIYFSSNPFLSEPIEETILELILEKETDLDILSLELIKEVENDEIKIIFLKNYLNKIELHEQLKKKIDLDQRTNRLSNDELIQKIVPQFYTIIESPKLASAIRKEAFELKKKSKESLEDALFQAKNKRQKKIDELLKSIVNMIQESSTFFQQKSFMLEIDLNENTISFSPERKQLHKFKDTEKIEEEFSPVRFIELSKDDNILEDINITNMKSAAIENTPAVQPTQLKPQGNLDTLETARKNNTRLWKPAGKFSSFAEFKDSLESKKNMKKKQKQQSKKIEEVEEKVRFKTPDVSDRKQTQKKKEYIKVVDLKGSSEPKPNKKMVFPCSPLVSPKNGRHINESTISWKNTIQTPEQLTAENIEIIYFKYLTKIHPMFSLLHSPSSSLKEEQKNSVLQALKSNHKDLFSDLIREKFMHQTVMKQAQQAKNEAMNMVTESQSLFKKNNQLREDFEWADNRYKTLQKDYTALIAKVKELENSDKNKTIAMANMEASYKKIKTCYAQKMEELQRLTKASQLQEKIAQAHEARLKKEYYGKISTKGILWSIILQRQKQSNTRINKQLLQFALFGFKINFYVEKQMKKMDKKRNYKTVKQHFKEWKLEAQAEKKYKALKKKMDQKWSLQVIALLKSHKIESTMQKLKEIWAHRFFSEKNHKKHFSTWKSLLDDLRQLVVKAEGHWVRAHQLKYFQALKELIEERKSFIFDISKKYEESSRNKGFHRMVYLMKKEMIENREKQTQVRLYCERLTRQFGYQRLKSCISKQKQFKASKNQLSSFLKEKSLKVMVSSFKKTDKQKKTLKAIIRNLNSLIIKKIIRREQTSLQMSHRINVRQTKTLLQNLKEHKDKRVACRLSTKQLNVRKEYQMLFNKLRLIKNLTALRLKGRNYVKKRAIQEMNFQMDLTDQRTLELIKQGQQSIEKCDQEIGFLKSQIQAQSNREVVLLAQNESLMLTFNQSCEIMQELRKEVEVMKEEYRSQEIRYNMVVKKYNEAVGLLQKANIKREGG